MKKFCIFCGSKPDKKTKEHIIPQWLIRMTEHDDRKTIFGVKNNTQISFPWMQYTFPACKVCNENFSELEGQIKSIIDKILLLHEALTLEDIIKLLDWFDKVRVGLWLGQSLLIGDELSPNFYINQRIGISDRILVICRNTDKDKGILFTGTESLAFKYSPSCFALTINELTFFNYSSAFLLAKNMGFPYPEKIETYPDGRIGVKKLKKGKLKIAHPLLEGNIIQPAIKIYQTILKAKNGHVIKIPIPKYQIKNSVICTESVLKSKPFIINDFTNYNCFIKNDEKIKFEFPVGYSKDVVLYNTAVNVLNHQKYEIERAIKTFDLLQEDKKKEQVDFYKFIIDENNKILTKLLD